ncbi:SDR family oxidoreductase [Fuscibacter oryzae]|uniref:SDR family oxidoreductase n=1 Tax=Fuscibacter oryzae TaxID=2803939 RepID=A0A8J7STF5_9RHOB|nr:SDR family oxidoreductase [Fuscibacter oryzae]MBL4929136.1 SDR family oxidoreductase [Fuscibacter oryzae]
MRNKVVIITGASQGIGAAAARVFAGAGAKVALLARNRPKVAELAAEIGADTALALPCDVSDWDQMRQAIAATVARFGRLDVLINNAGVIEPMARLADSDPALWDHAVDINLKGVYHGIRAALPVMKAQGTGTIITTSSGAATNPYDGWSAYCTSKAGALMLTRALHLEEGANGIRALGLSPGTVATEMQVKIKASGVGPVAQLDPAVHIPAEWPARALLWMCGPAADGWLGKDISLRDEAIRIAAGLI